MFTSTSSVSVKNAHVLPGSRNWTENIFSSGKKVRTRTIAQQPLRSSVLLAAPGNSSGRGTCSLGWLACCAAGCGVRSSLETKADCKKASRTAQLAAKQSSQHEWPQCRYECCAKKIWQCHVGPPKFEKRRKARTRPYRGRCCSSKYSVLYCLCRDLKDIHAFPTVFSSPMFFAFPSLLTSESQQSFVQEFDTLLNPFEISQMLAIFLSSRTLRRFSCRFFKSSVLIFKKCSLFEIFSTV